MACCFTTLYSTVEVYKVSIKGRRKIDYECNLCKKTRILYVLPTLHQSVDEKGYVEYVDIHPCEDDRLNANILYVDKSMVVRSQVPVRVGDNMTAQEISTMQIPVPKKVDFKTAIIEPAKDFKYKNVKSLKITDRLRQTIFMLEEKGAGKKLQVTSDLEFIDIEIKIGKGVDIDIAEDWLKQLASILEAIVLLDEEMLTFMALYLDPKISQPPSGESIIELDMILHAKSSFPIASLKSYATFRRQWSRIKSERKGTDFESYEKLLTYCIGNQYKTLLDIYFKAESAMSFLTYIDRIEDMSMLGLINIRKTEFFTVDD